MSESLTLVVPADAPYRALGAEVAAKCAELSGGTAADGQALAAAVTSAVDSAASSAGEGSQIDLTFTVAESGIEIEIRCGGRSSHVKQPLPARKG